MELIHEIIDTLKACGLKASVKFYKLTRQDLCGACVEYDPKPSLDESGLDIDAHGHMLPSYVSAETFELATKALHDSVLRYATDVLARHQQAENAIKRHLGNR